MNNKLILFAALLPIGACTTATKETEVKPNIIYILADDLGYGDLSLLGQAHFSTPNIDRMASEGMVFTQHYSGSTVCAPARSSLMTGLTTGHTPIRGNKEVQPEGQWPMPSDAYTIAEMLWEAGYTTAAFGKWGLGYPGSEGDPNKQGFDEFFGYNCQRQAHHYYPYHLWHNQQKIVLEGNRDKATGQYGPELVHQKALKFLEENNPNLTGKPFFMFYPSLLPHAELLAPEIYMAKHRGKYGNEVEYKGVDDGPEFRNGPYCSQTEPRAAFAAMVNVLDDQVGEILEKLKALGLDKNTLVIFTSDNGPHQEGGADPDFFNSNGPLKGYKRDLYEGGIRVPMIAWWPGKIAPGSQTDHISAFWDMMPTFAGIAQVSHPPQIDGISILPTLLGSGDQPNHGHLYWEFHEKGGRQAIRKGKWKLVRYNVFDPSKTTTELYDLENDLGEDINVAGQHPEITEELVQLITASRTHSDIFTFQSPTIIR